MNLPRLQRRALFLLCAGTLLVSAAQAQSAPKVRFQTTLGEFTVEVYPDKAPKTAANFLQYVQDKQYDGTVFHRVMDNFMVQGGGMTPDMKEKATRAPIPLEARNGLRNDRGSIAMARTGNPHSATAQFFINVADNGFLNHSAPTSSGWGYAVFGRVTAGTDVVDKITAVKTGRKGFHDDVPLEDVRIEKAVAL